MEIDKIIAICGVNCTECDAYNATNENDTKALETIAAEWTEGLGRTFDALNELKKNLRGS